MRFLIKYLLIMALGFTLGVSFLFVRHMTGRPGLETWHLAALQAEPSGEEIDRMSGLQDYLDRESMVFEQLEKTVHRSAEKLPISSLSRFQRGSWSDPTGFDTNWNRTFELPAQSPRANILMLHGMSDSPYSLKPLAESLHQSGCRVILLRLPGHGTAPAGLTQVKWPDLTAAVRLAARELTSPADPGTPLYLVGYSNGAALALEYTASSLLGEALRKPDGLVLISPAISISPVANLAKWHLRLARLPGLRKLAWLSIEPEFDPYKYNSFAVNGAMQVNLLTKRVHRQIDDLADGGALADFPPVLAMQSLADATTPAKGLIDRLMKRLAPNGHKLVLFDINRLAADMAILRNTHRQTVEELMSRQLPFTVALVTNKTATGNAVEIREKPAGGTTVTLTPTDLTWPPGVYSLSHVALPFPVTDPIYGLQPHTGFSLGRLEPRGETGLLTIPVSNLLRLRSNPFYDILERQVASSILGEQAVQGER